MRDLFNVSGKVAVISGGSSGIGAMMALGLLENGAKVYITARRAEPLAAMADELSQLGECIAIPSEMSSTDGISSLVEEVAANEHQVDILINNAGANWAEPIDTFPEAGWDKVMDINIKAIFFTTQQFLPLLRASGAGGDPARVINIASVHGIRNPGLPTYAYTASKSGVIHLTRHLATDLASAKVNVNAIAPGLFPSKMTKDMIEDEEYNRGLMDQIPCDRMGTPEDIAGTAIFLSSQASSWVTGQTVVLDGGMTATP